MTNNNISHLCRIYMERFSLSHGAMAMMKECTDEGSTVKFAPLTTEIVDAIYKEHKEILERGDTTLRELVLASLGWV